jgi:hypothetical protein
MDDDLYPLEVGQTNFPAHIKEYGETFANEFTQTVHNLNKMGVNYSDLDKSEASTKKVFNDWLNASPNKKKSDVSINQMQIDPITFAEKYRNLTNIQISFIERIIDEYSKSSSYDDLSGRLLKINEDIYAQVPAIQQDRLFHITSVLYYGMKEVQNIEKQGQMPFTPSTKPVMRLKSGNEDGGGGFWGTCRQISAYVWTLAVGEIYQIGATLEVVAEVTIAAAGLFLVTLCAVGLSGDTDWNVRCAEKYASCMDGPYGNPNSGGWGYTMCARCLEYCRAQHSWDCPRPL